MVFISEYGKNMNQMVKVEGNPKKQRLKSSYWFSSRWSLTYWVQFTVVIDVDTLKIVFSYL